MNIKSALPSVAVSILLTVVGKSFASNQDAGYAVDIHFVQHRFVPGKLEVPAKVPLTIRVVNASRERIEFESFKLGREKVVDPGATVVVHVPALRAGTYDFYDDFHDDVPEGKIVAK